MPQLPVVLPFIFGVVEADVSLAVTVNSEVVFTYNADSGLVVAAGSSGDTVRGTTADNSTAVTVGLTAGIQFNGALESDVPVSVNTSGEVLYNQHLDADLPVNADLSGAALNAAAEGSNLAVTVEISGLADMDATADSSTPIVVNLDSAALNNAPIDGHLSGVAGASAQARFDGKPEGVLGAVLGLSGSATRSTFGAASAVVTVAVTAGMSLAQRVQTGTAVTASPVTVPLRRTFAGSNTVGGVVSPVAAALVDAIAAAELAAVGSLSATVALDQVISAPLALLVELAARGQLGGTPEERIALIEGVLRLVEIESREGPLVVAADDRVASVGGTREMLV